MNVTRWCVARWILVTALMPLGACSPDDGRWVEAQKADTSAAYESYLDKHPSGKHAEAAPR